MPVKVDNLGREYEVWSEDQPYFPWWMDWEAVKEQGDYIDAKYSTKIQDRFTFTPDWPKLAKTEYQYLFVYGTLKRNKGNDHRLPGNQAQFISRCFTTEPYFTLRETAGRIPVMLAHYGEKKNPDVKRVEGELYLVKSSHIPSLDIFESNGFLYKRLRLRVETGKFVVPAWMYIGLKAAWPEASGYKLCPSFTATKDPDYSYYTYVGHDNLTQKKAF